MINGVINIYKEPGYTSFDVVAKLRGILKQKKIGHTGTLDPMASGVLLVCLGSATKLVDIMTLDKKQYEAELLLGVATDTEDVTGRVLRETEVSVSEEAVIDTVKSFIGRSKQIPPMYSAIKKDGKKLYEYARQGIEIEREARDIEIYDISDISVNLPVVHFSVYCSKGTYIRSLCRDIGDRLGCGGSLKSLKRSEIRGFLAEDALSLDRVSQLVSENKLESYIIPVDEILNEYKRLDLKPEFKKSIQNGNKLVARLFMTENSAALDGELFRVYHEDKFYALYQYVSKESVYKPYKMFLD